jgi:hypothetical protein
LPAVVTVTTGGFVVVVGFDGDVLGAAGRGVAVGVAAGGGGAAALTGRKELLLSKEFKSAICRGVHGKALVYSIPLGGSTCRKYRKSA